MAADTERSPKARSGRATTTRKAAGKTAKKTTTTKKKARSSSGSTTSKARRPTAKKTSTKSTTAKVTAKKKTTSKAASPARNTRSRAKTGDGSPATASVHSPVAMISAEQRHRMIAEAAYYRSQRREPGSDDPERNWYAAEAEIDALLLRGRTTHEG